MIKLLALIIAVEAVTEILVASEIFAKLRELTYKISVFLGKLFSCGYCMSVWISTLFVCFCVTPELSYYPIVDKFITIFVIHRLSNIWHEFISRWLNRAPISLAIHKTETIVMEQTDGTQKN